MSIEFKRLPKKAFRRLARTAFVTKLISALIYWYTLLVARTTRWQIKGVDEFYRTWEEHGSLILVGWHGRALMYPSFWNGKKPLNALVSLHQDGQMIAGVLKKYGFGIIGGSTNGNARGAALDLMRSLLYNRAICIIPDGPRGPRMRLNMSPIYYAQKTGKPLFGITYSVDKAHIIQKAWDKMMIPFPFSRGICCVTEPVFIPADADEAQLENYRRNFENALNQLSINCDRLCGIEPILPAPEGTAKTKRTG